MYCKNCGKKAEPGAAFCVGCGMALPARRVPWHSRGRLAPDAPGRRWTSCLAALGLFLLQIGLVVLFSGLRLREPDLKVAQLVGFVPTLVLILYIYRLDTLDREPLGLLAALFVLEGIVSETAVLSLELALNERFAPPAQEQTVLWRFVEAFFLVALVEELGKYAVLRKLTWRSPAFNYRFDGVVYASVTALGFAAFENFGYIAAYGLGAALTRGITAVPGHCVDGILMGLFYGQAKVCACRGQRRKALILRMLSIAAPAAEHGAYDFVAGSENATVKAVFFFYVMLLNAVAFTAVWRLAQKDEALARPEG